MRELFKKLIQDESGVIVSTEIVLVGTILVLGCMTGLSSLSYAVNQELNDVAQRVTIRTMATRIRMTIRSNTAKSNPN